MSQKRIILSDSSLNRYGYRVLTAGLLLEAFIDNPVMLYGHFRDEGSPLWCDYKAIGYWDDIKIEDDVLSAIPVFDKVDDLSKTIAAKYEAGTLRAASIGIRILATRISASGTNTRNCYQSRSHGGFHRGYPGQLPCRALIRPFLLRFTGSGYGHEYCASINNPKRKGNELQTIMDRLPLFPGNFKR